MTAEQPAEHGAEVSAASGPPAHVQFKSGGDIPAVGGAFRATTSDTDAAYAPAATGEQHGQNVQFIRGAMQGPTLRVRINPKTGIPEQWSATEQKWIVHDADGRGSNASGGG